jgi:hypothetical protein
MVSSIYKLIFYFNIWKICELQRKDHNQQKMLYTTNLKGVALILLQ